MTEPNDSNLLDLGFPADLLANLTEEDLLHFQQDASTNAFRSVDPIYFKIFLPVTPE